MAALRPFFACHEAKPGLFIFSDFAEETWILRIGPLEAVPAVRVCFTGAVRVAAKLEPSASVRREAIASVFFIRLSLCHQLATERARYAEKSGAKHHDGAGLRNDGC